MSLLVPLWLLLLQSLALIAAAQQQVVNLMLLPTDPNSAMELNGTQQFLDDNFTKATGIKINVQMSATLVTTEYSSTVKLYLTTSDPSIDIFMIDVVWPGDLAKYLVDMTPYITPDIAALHVPQIWSNDIVAGRHVALPFFADYGVFYYRKDLLTKYGYSGPPTTWDEMEAMALNIVKGEGGDMAGFIAEFDGYEGLTCNVMEWLASANGGTVVDLGGNVNFNNANASRILQRASSWFNSGVTPKYTLSYQETPALNKWLAGKAVFMRSWPYVAGQTAQANVSWSFGMTGIPGETDDTKFSATLGGWHLAANSATRNISATAQAMLYLSSNPAFQRFRAQSISVLPTISSLYQDPVVCAKIDCQLFGSLKVVTRPAPQSAPNYLAVSADIYTAVNQYLAQQVDLQQMLYSTTIKIEQTMGTYSSIIASQASTVGSNSVLGMIFIGLSIVGLFLCVLCAVLTVINMAKSNIKASSPIFLLVILFGVAMGFCTIFVNVGAPTKLLCILQPWLLTMSFAVTFSALIAKTWRIFRIFGNRRLGGAALDTWSLLKFMIVVIVSEAIILGVWTVTDTPQPTVIFTSADSAYLGCVSSKSNVYSAVLISVNGILLVFGSWLAYKTRLVDERYRESYYIALLSYNTLVWSAIAISLVFITSLGLILQFSVRSTSIILSCLGVLALLFFPKFRDVYGAPPEAPMTLKIQDSSRKASTFADQSTSRSAGGKSVTGISSDPNFETGEAYGHGVTLYFRAGKNPLFLGNWLSVRCYVLREGSSFTTLVLAPEGRDKGQKLGGACITLTGGNSEIIRNEMDEERSNYQIAARLPDGLYYEFMADSVDGLQFLENALTRY